MSILLCSLVHTILIRFQMGLHQSVFPNSISRIPDYLVGFSGSTHYGTTTNRC